MASVKTALLVIMSMPFVGAAIAAGAPSNPPLEEPEAPKPATTAPQKSQQLGLAGRQTALSGIESKVGAAYDCYMKTHAPAIWARADHGTVVIREIDGPGCNEKSMKLAGIFYKSDPGFVGEDKIYVIGYSTEGSIDSTFSVEVSKKKSHASAQKDHVSKQ